ncbi:hypothetical protein ACFFWC_27605 [Plantactinospora siamensis]|uniref:Secreted protein n=1 Tax=Plantactinospora siamensis TaxID=555372 RepID=A0ABV6NXT4_9ACTN
MKAPFRRWLPAIAHTPARLVRSASGRVRPPALRMSAAVRSEPLPRTAAMAFRPAAVAAVRPARAIARYPVPNRAILVATGLTAAAALAGHPVVDAQTAGSTPVRPAAVADSATATAAPGTGSSSPAGDAGVASAGGVAGAGGGAGAGKPAAEKSATDGTAAGRTGAGKAGQPAAVPSMQTLVPFGTQGPQSYISLTPAQTENARTIVRTARQLGLPDRAAVIAVATSLQESKLDNLGHLGYANDHDSLGLFQQRPSAGWGSPDQVTDPRYAATAFYNGLRNVPDWQDLPLTDAAQRVQVSAFPYAYAQWEQQAADIVRDVWGR